MITLLLIHLSNGDERHIKGARHCHGNGSCVDSHVISHIRTSNSSLLHGTIPQALYLPLTLCCIACGIDILCTSLHLLIHENACIHFKAALSCQLCIGNYANRIHDMHARHN
ncbi:hypothetical protein D1872_246900 [compost metagenome]